MPIRLPSPFRVRVPRRSVHLGLAASTALLAGTVALTSPPAVVEATPTATGSCPGQNFTLRLLESKPLAGGAHLRIFNAHFLTRTQPVRVAVTTAPLSDKLTLRPLVSKVIERRDIEERASAPGYVSAINGDFFDMNYRGETVRHIVQDGAFIKGNRVHRVMVGFDENGRMQASKMHLDGTVTLKRTVTIRNPKTRKTRRVEKTIGTTKLFGINTLKGKGIILYNPLAGRLREDHRDIEVLLRNNRVVETREKRIPLTPATGTRIFAVNPGYPGADLLAQARVGDRIDWTMKQVSDNPVPFVHAIGAGGRIAKGGVNVADCSDYYNREDAPRTGVGWSSDGKTVAFATAVDAGGWYAGLTTAGMAKVFLDLKIPNAVLVDGGGSTQMFVRDNLKNSPYRVDLPWGYQRAVPNGLGLQVPAKYR